MANELKVGVLAVLESHRDSWGDLDAAGWSLEQLRLFTLRNPHPSHDAALQQRAAALLSADQSLRSAGRVPVIRRYRRAALARVQGVQNG